MTTPMHPTTDHASAATRWPAGSEPPSWARSMPRPSTSATASGSIEPWPTAVPRRRPSSRNGPASTVRYAREWLEHQAVGAILDVDDVAAAPDDRRYTLPAAHADVLRRRGEPRLPGTARADGRRHGPAPARRARPRTGPAAASTGPTTGPMSWRPRKASTGPSSPTSSATGSTALPDVAARLRESGGRVADVACGTGWSSISIARHFPKVEVDGIDIDAGSIERAKRHAAAMGLTDRVSFLFADAAAADGAGRYDLVTIFEAVHDMARPVEVLAAARRLLAPGGAVLIGDERVAEQFTAPGDEAERPSTATASSAASPTAWSTRRRSATGTVMRPGRRGDRARGGLLALHDPADRARLVPLLPPRSVARLDAAARRTRSA